MAGDGLAVGQSLPQQLAARMKRETAELAAARGKIRELLRPLRPWQRRMVIDGLATYREWIDDD